MTEQPALGEISIVLILFLLGVVAWVYIVLRRLNKRNYINRLRPERLERGDKLSNCYYSFSAADHTEGKVDAIRILYPAGAHFVDSNGDRQIVLRTSKKMRSEVSSKRIPTMPENDHIKVIEVLDVDKDTCATSIDLPLVDDVEDRVALVIVADHLRLARGLKRDVRKILYDLLGATSETSISPKEITRAAESLRKTKARVTNPRLKLAKERSTALLARLKEKCELH